MKELKIINKIYKDLKFDFEVSVSDDGYENFAYIGTKNFPYILANEGKVYVAVYAFEDNEEDIEMVRNYLNEHSIKAYVYDNETSFTDIEFN